MAQAVIAIVGIAFSAKQQSKARKSQRRASEIGRKRADIQNAKLNRRRIAEGRRLRAQTIAAGQAAGAGGSSAVAGAAGAVTTQTASNVSFQNTLAGLDSARFDALSRANTAISQAATGTAVANLPQQLGFGSTGQSITSFFNG